MAKIIPIPIRGPASAGAGVFVRLRSRAKVTIGRALAKLRLPGAVSPVEIDDPVTGMKIRINVGPLFTRIEINGRDFYFDRFSGRFDGTGQGCA